VSQLSPRAGKIQLSPADAAVLWHDWHENQNIAFRDRLIEHYLPFARMMAAKLYGKRHCAEFEFDDYLQFATIGLIESIDRYNPDSDSASHFTTYATKRIQGAILDGVERLSERQQQINTRQRRQNERTALQGSILNDPSARGNVFDQLAEIAVGLALGYILEDTNLYLNEEPVMPDNQYCGIELRQLRERLLALVEQLPEQERLLIKYTYFNHMAFESVAQRWGVTRSRIAQIHRSALEHLRKSSLDLRQYDVAW
jgi:RNA polymerase sigma factor for flagellar operon FliA